MSANPDRLPGRAFAGGQSRVVGPRDRARAAWIRAGKYRHGFQPLTKRVCIICDGRKGDGQHR